MSRIYVASSWRNVIQPSVVVALRAAGHEVYDFRNPPNASGFRWEEVGLTDHKPTVKEYREALKHPRAIEGFMSDYNAMKAADVCVLVLPCGRSAHLELGWMAGQGKSTFILTQDGQEAELMALLANHICGSIEEVVELLA